METYSFYAAPHPSTYSRWMWSGLSIYSPVFIDLKTSTIRVNEKILILGDFLSDSSHIFNSVSLKIQGNYIDSTFFIPFLILLGNFSGILSLSLTVLSSNS